MSAGERLCGLYSDDLDSPSRCLFLFLQWTIWLLANNPDVQRKLRAECLEFLAHSASGHPSYYELRELKYLNAVVVESLRVRPSVPGTFRKSTKDSYLDGIWCPKGTVSRAARRTCVWKN